MSRSPPAAALGPLHLAEVVAAPGDQVALAHRFPQLNRQRQGLLGFPEAAAQPLGQAEVTAGVGSQHPLVRGCRGQGLRGQRSGPVAIAAEFGQIGAVERDRGRDVRQHAGLPARRRLVELAG
jgi:hypothetical protein